MPGKFRCCDVPIRPGSVTITQTFYRATQKRRFKNSASKTAQWHAFARQLLPNSARKVTELLPEPNSPGAGENSPSPAAASPTAWHLGRAVALGNCKTARHWARVALGPRGRTWKLVATADPRYGCRQSPAPTAPPPFHPLNTAVV